MNILKSTVKKIPFLNSVVKPFYDEVRERSRQRKIKQFLQKELPFTVSPPPFYSVGHEPTIRCNLRCQMCYQGQTRALRQNELNAQDILRSYQWFKGRAEEIKIVGGEPFVRPDIYEMIDFCARNDISISLQTNMTLVDESAVNRLKKYKNISAFLTSIDGPREVHDSIRGAPGAFDKTVAAIRLIKKEVPWAEVSVFGMILIESNFNSLKEICDIVKSFGIGGAQFIFEQVYQSADVEASRRLLSQKLGWQPDEYRINTQIRENLFAEAEPEQVKKKIGELINYGLKKECFVNLVPYNFYKNIDAYLGLNNKQRVFCTKLLNPELRMIQTGDVVWCDILENSFGNLTKTSPDEIWLSDRFQSFRSFLKDNSLPICRRCCKAVYI